MRQGVVKDVSNSEDYSLNPDCKDNVVTGPSGQQRDRSSLF